MRNLLMFTGALWSIAWSAAEAQPVGQGQVQWSGPFVGASISETFGNWVGVVEIDPARDSRFVYLQGPRGQTVRMTGPREHAVIGDARAGTLFQRGRLVWGGELTLNEAGFKQSQTFGPFDAGTLSTQFLSGVAPPVTTTDMLHAEAEVGSAFTMRVRAGITVGPRILVSGFVGPSATQARLGLRQSSVIENLTCDNHPVRPGPCFTTATTLENFGPDARETLWGATAGVAIDYWLTDHWTLHSEAAATRYQSISARSGGRSGGDSELAYKPHLYSLSLGLSYHF